MHRGPIDEIQERRTSSNRIHEIGGPQATSIGSLLLFSLVVTCPQIFLGQIVSTFTASFKTPTISSTNLQPQSRSSALLYDSSHFEEYCGATSAGVGLFWPLLPVLVLLEFYFSGVSLDFFPVCMRSMCSCLVTVSRKDLPIAVRPVLTRTSVVSLTK